MYFIRHAVRCGEQKTQDETEARKVRKPRLISEGTRHEESEEKIVAEVNDLVEPGERRLDGEIRPARKIRDEGVDGGRWDETRDPANGRHGPSILPHEARGM